MITEHRTNGNGRRMVSIGLPVYNGERFIEHAIRSILAQTHPDFELIISDNASTDGTGEICQRLAAGDERIKYVRQPRNMGAANNFRYVWEVASHDRFIWAAADDWWDPDRLEHLVNALTEEDSVVMGPVRRYVSAQPYAEFVPMPYTKGDWWRYFMREEARCEKIYFVYGLFWRSKARQAMDCLTDQYASDDIFCYRMLWEGNLRSMEKGVLHVRAHEKSGGHTQAAGYRFSVSRLIYRAHPWDYYKRYVDVTPSGHRFHLALFIPIKHVAAQVHLWWRAFCRVVLRRPYVHGALPGGEILVRDVGL